MHGGFRDVIIADKYEVVEEIGRGGMGVVYCVRHLDLDTLFALKMIPRELSDDAATVERFRREARVMAQLNHRHIARVFDLARDGDTYYLIMEFLQGRNLRRYLRDLIERSGWPPPLADVLRIGMQIASALAYAHSRMPTIVHRDIKPSNIILEDEVEDLLLVDSAPRAVVTDFGIAKLLGEAQASLTNSQGFVGTLMYAAPEQMQRGLDVDGRADVYALGAVLYELATGVPVFAGCTNEEIVGRVFSGEEADVHALTAVDPDLARIIGRALALDRQARHPSARALHADLLARWQQLEGGDPTADDSDEAPSDDHPPPADPAGAGERHDRDHAVVVAARSGTRREPRARPAPPRRAWTRRAAATLHWLGERAWAIGLMLPALAVAALCVAEGIAWIGRPFPGFLLLENRVVPTVAGYEWSGGAAGLPFHSVITAVDGVPVTSSDAVYAHADAAPVGTTLLHTARKDGVTREVAVPTQRFGVRDYLITFGLMSLNGVLILGMGLVVGLLSPHNRSARVFLVMSLMMGLFPLTGIDLYRTHRFPAALHLLLQCLAPATFIHLALVFPVERRLGRLGRGLVALPYLLGLALAVAVVRAFQAEPPELVPLYGAYAFAVVGLLALVVGALTAYLRERRTLVRGRVQVVMIGVVAAFLLPIAGFFDNAFGGGEFPINLIALTPMLFFLAVGYAIAKHRLFDTELLIRRGVVFGTLLAGFTGLYVVAVSALNLVLARNDVMQSPALMGVFMAVALAQSLPLRERLSTVIERRLFPHKHRFHRTLQEISQEIMAMGDRDAVLAHVMTTLAGAVDATSSTVLLQHEGDDSLRIAAAFGRVPAEYAIPGDETLVRLLATTRSEIFVDDLLEDPALAAVRDACTPVFETLHAELMLPLLGEHGMLGILTLGRLHGGAMLTSEDLHVLRALGAAVAVTIARSRDAVHAELIAEQRRALQRHLPARSPRGPSGADLEPPSARWTHVTILAIQLGRLQTFADRAGPEATTRLLRQYYTICDRLLRKHGGLAERHDEARLTAVLGVSPEHPDHSLRAARVALAMRARLEQQRATWRSDGYELVFRCGIAAGFAHVTTRLRDDHPHTFSAMIDVAEQLADSAEPGTILADAATVADLGSAIARTELGPRTLPACRQALIVSRLEGEA